MEITVGYTKNHWTVTGHPYRKGAKLMAECTCSCGKVRDVQMDHVKAGRSKSCGHNNGQWNVTHGMTGTPTYRTWNHMLDRCRNPKCGDWPDYGGRGIKVCPEWEASFEAFHKDMGDKPEGMTLDRIDVDGDYTPGNCRWATDKEQARNTRTNVLVEYRGETHPISEWAEIIGMEYRTLYTRIVKLGWDVERAIEEPSTRWSGRKHSPDAIKKMRENSHAAVSVTCPHCGKTGGKTIMKRWHFDRCKKAA